MPIEHSGQCVCGAVRYICTGRPDRVTICHCLWCQRRTGTAFGTEVVFQEENVIFSGLTPTAYRHRSDESGRWLEIYFCPCCGSNFGSTSKRFPGVRAVPAGTFNDPSFLNDKDIKYRHVFARSRREWNDLTADVEVYEEHFRTQ